MVSNHISKCLAVVFGLVLSQQVNATDIKIVNSNGAGVGLRSNASVSPEGGNSATTLGQSYLNVFEAAANFWEKKIDSSVEIRVRAQIIPDLICTSTGAQLGGAGPINAFINTPGAPIANTIYPVALASALAGEDLDPGRDDIDSVFNSQLDGRSNCLGGIRWWRGTNGDTAPSGTISLYDTVLHEIGHGLGFLTFVGQDGSRLENFNDHFMRNLFDRSANKKWTSMNNTERARSSINNGNLVWTGNDVDEGASVVTGGRSGGLLRMFAPSSFQRGSSVSHWDTALSPDELMEPFATRTSVSCATILAMKDMGWNTRSECSSGPGAVPPMLFLLLDDEG